MNTEQINKWLASNGELWRDGQVMTLAVFGNVLPRAETLRAAGGWWSAKRKAWLFPMSAFSAVKAIVQPHALTNTGLIINFTTPCRTQEQADEMASMISSALEVK